MIGGRRRGLAAAIKRRASWYGRWGRFQAVNPDWRGRFSGRLHVYPPGTTPSTRRLLSLWGFLTDWLGLALVWVGALLTGDRGIGWLACYLVAAGVGAWALLATTRRARRETRTVSVTNARREGAAVLSFLFVAEALIELDANDTGDRVAYEAAWGEIYHDMMPVRQGRKS